MDLARTVPLEIDLDAELTAAYPLLTRRLTVVLHDPDEAQDVAQSAFTRALERRNQFRGGDVRAWLYTIGIRLALNELRRHVQPRGDRSGDRGELAVGGGDVALAYAGFNQPLTIGMGIPCRLAHRLRAEPPDTSATIHGWSRPRPAARGGPDRGQE